MQQVVLGLRMFLAFGYPAKSGMSLAVSLRLLLLLLSSSPLGTGRMMWEVEDDRFAVSSCRRRLLGRAPPHLSWRLTSIKDLAEDETPAMEVMKVAEGLSSQAAPKSAVAMLHMWPRRDRVFEIHPTVSESRIEIRGTSNHGVHAVGERGARGALVEGTTPAHETGAIAQRAVSEYSLSLNIYLSTLWPLVRPPITLRQSCQPFYFFMAFAPLFKPPMSQNSPFYTFLIINFMLGNE